MHWSRGYVPPSSPSPSSHSRTVHLTLTRSLHCAGGSTIGALAHLVERNPYAFEGFGLGIGVDADELEEAAQGRAGKKKQVGVGREGGGKAAGRIWDMIRCVSALSVQMHACPFSTGVGRCYAEACERGLADTVCTTAASPSPTPTSTISPA